jgi:hypothetical protein
MASDRYAGRFGQIRCPGAVLVSGGDIKRLSLPKSRVEHWIGVFKREEIKVSYYLENFIFVHLFSPLFYSLFIEFHQNIPPPSEMK